ncbi:MAG: hypothetical protein WC565_10545 [Parcubacteria group bacterium]|jgi:hypothetical protein
MSKSKEPPKVCGEVPSHDVTWQVVLKDPEKHPMLTRSFEEARTAFSAFTKASPKLGNPSFSDVVCTIVPEEQAPAPALEPKRKKRCRCSK